MKLTFDPTIRKYFLKPETIMGPYTHKVLTKENSNFKYDHMKNLWYSHSIRDAARFRDYADEATKNHLNRYLIDVTPWSGSIPFPPKESITPDQIKAVHFAMARNHSYIAADPGTGKTIMGALIINCLKPHFVVIICPPHAVPHWNNELKKWSKYAPTTKFNALPDSVLAQYNREYLRGYFQAQMGDGKNRLLIIDEAHRFKLGVSGKLSKRAGMLFGRGNLVGLFNKVVCLSGTPQKNRPLELYPVLKRLAPEVIDSMSPIEYGMKYCNGHIDKDGAWNFKGASNTEELYSRMKEKFMLRIKKDRKDYTEKTESLVFLSENSLSKDFIEFDKLALMKADPHKIEALDKSVSARYRRLLGLEKVVPAALFLRDELNKDKTAAIVVIAHHKDVIHELANALSFYRPITVTGEDPLQTKQMKISMFQDYNDHRIFITNITECITLTKANKVRLLEPAWSPEDNRQAIDRIDRIGQKRDIDVKYLCFKNSLDRIILETNLRKKAVIDQL